MTYFADLSACTYFGRWEDKLVASAGSMPNTRTPSATSTGSSSPSWRSCSSDPWQPFVAAGFHRCELCGSGGVPPSLSVDGRKVALGVNNLFVPNDRVVFVAPSLIAHYIDAHRYAPPLEFRVAVMQCPATGSTEYLRSIRARGIALP